MVISVLPGLPELENLYNEAFFAGLEDAYFINLGRGIHVDELALLNAMNKTVKAAALDVLKDEPLEPKNPLLNCSSIYVTPHVGGYDSGYWTNQVNLFAHNLDCYLVANTNTMINLHH